MASKKQIVVIGAGYAGMLATVRLAGKTQRAPVEITLVNASENFVERLRLHEFAANRDIRQRPIRDTLRGTGVQFVQGMVSKIDPERCEITVQTANDSRQIRYDTLLYALGSIIERESIPGLRDHAYTLTPSSARSAAALREVLPTIAARGGQVVVCGGGATGIEAAAEFASRYPTLQVRLVTRGELGIFKGEPVAAYMRQSLKGWGVTIQDHTTIREVQSNQIITEGGAAIPFDVCLWTGGFSVPTLARESGLAVNERGQILVDPFLRSISHPDIYAVGDAASPVEVPGVPVRMAAFTAVVMGTHGADNLASLVKGRPQKPFSFIYVGQGIALGRNKAIGFGSSPTDVPKRPFFTERAGYAVREFFVNTLAALPNLERRWPGFFYWLGKGWYTKQQSHQPSAKTEKLKA